MCAQPDSDMQRICAIAWAIWARRNDLTWEGKVRPVHHVYNHGVGFLNEWLRVQVSANYASDGSVVVGSKGEVVWLL